MITALATVVCLAVPAVLPASGRLVDGFRPPVCPRCEGNRGLEFATAPGQRVVAPVVGEVGFAGAVAGRLYVVIRTDGTRNLNAVIGGLASTTVTRGVRVEAGDPIGLTGGGLFFGFRLGPRRDGVYLDPGPLVAGSRKRARLVAPVSAPVSLARRSNPRVRPEEQHKRHCSVLPPVVASARGPGP